MEKYYSKTYFIGYHKNFILTHEKVKWVLLWNNMAEEGVFTGILPQNIQHKFLPTY